MGGVSGGRWGSDVFDSCFRQLLLASRPAVSRRLSPSLGTLGAPRGSGVPESELTCGSDRPPVSPTDEAASFPMEQMLVGNENGGERRALAC